MRGVSRDLYNTRLRLVLYDSRDTHPSAVFFMHTSIGGALSDILYFLVVWLREIFYSAQTAASFVEHDISKCLNNLFLVLEQTNRVSFASFIDYIVTHMINHAVGGIVFERHRNQTITKSFLAIEQIHWIGLAGFSEFQCDVYVSVYVAFLTLHNCTVFAQLAA